MNLISESQVLELYKKEKETYVDDYKYVPKTIVKIHDFSEAFLYFHLYQNILSKFAVDGVIKTNLVNLLNLCNTNETELYMFLHTINNMYINLYHMVKVFKDNSQLDDTARIMVQNALNKYPEKYLQDIINKSEFKDGDMIDIENYCGTGLFLIYHDRMDNKFVVIPTLGDYGDVLPEPGFSLVLRYGLKYFVNTEVTAFQIGHIRDIKIKNEDTMEYEAYNENKPLYVMMKYGMEYDEGMTEFMVQGKKFTGYISDVFI
jgi:hypothetical protein